MAEKDPTKSTKLSYEVRGVPLLATSQLLKILERRSDEFLLLNNGHVPYVKGVVGKTGLIVVAENGSIAAAVRHPRHIPNTLDLENREVTFGGPQSEAHVEIALEMPIGMERVIPAAKTIMGALDHFGDIKQTSEMFNGLGAVGSEPEAWATNPHTGDLVEISGGELQLGLIEQSVEAIADPNQFLHKRSKQILGRKQQLPDATIIDTSVLLTSNPLALKVNNGGDLGAYIQAVQERLFEDYFNYSDPLAESVMDDLAKRFCLNGHQDLRETRKDMAYWVMAASHASVGMHHRRTGNKALWVSAEEALGVSNMFNSDLATPTEFLMMSTPMIFGETPTIDGQWPIDYRAVLRYLIDTANPAEFVDSPQQMYANITHAVTTGLTQTMDRGTFLSMVNGKVVSPAHGRVRNRISSSEPKNLTGRVEFTGCSSSPSLIDELARNSFLQVLTFASYEALSHGQYPQQYFAEAFPSAASWQNQKNISVKAALFGFNHPEVKALIDESIAFLHMMEERHPALSLQVAIAEARLQNLTLPPVDSLEEYGRNPRGPISEVIQREITKGISPIELARRIEKYQLDISSSITSGQFRLDYDRIFKILQENRASIFIRE